MCTSIDVDETQIRWLTKLRALTKVGDVDYVNMDIFWSDHFQCTRTVLINLLWLNMDDYHQTGHQSRKYRSESSTQC